MTGRPGFPYWRIAGYYFFYFAGLGAFLPYWGLYLAARQYSPEEIGQLMALVAGTKIFAPNLWGWLADRSDQPLRWIRLAGFAAALAFTGFFWFEGFWRLFGVTLLFSFFWNACLPLFESVTLRHLGVHAYLYSRVRLWGSIGFIASVGALGYGLRGVFAIGCLPLLVAALLACLWLFSLSVPGTRWTADVGAQRFWPMLRRREVLAFFFVTMLLQLSHGPYYVFFTLYLEGAGFAPDRIGQLWALGVIAEIVLFLCLHRLLRRYTLRGILLAALLLAALRWTIVGWGVPHLGLLVFAQCLHAASFGAIHAVGIQLTHKYFTGRHGSKGQALYSSASFGLGGALGSWGAGELWRPLGPEMVYSIAAGCCLLAWAIGWRWVQPARRRGVRTAAPTPR